MKKIEVNKKMGWKKFFKPTKLKIIITVILILIFNFLPIIPCIKGLVGSEMVRESSKLSLCSPFLETIGGYQDYFGLKNGKLIAYLYIIIISYSISNLIAYITKKDK